MKLSYLLASVSSVQESRDGKTWCPSRPQTAENTFLKYRIKAAWRVLVGKSDAVEWDGKNIPTTSDLKVVGFISTDILTKLNDPGWQILRNTPADLWTVNSPPSRARIPVYIRSAS